MWKKWTFPLQRFFNATNTSFLRTQRIKLEVYARNYISCFDREIFIVGKGLTLSLIFLSLFVLNWVDIRKKNTYFLKESVVIEAIAIISWLFCYELNAISLTQSAFCLPYGPGRDLYVKDQIKRLTMKMQNNSKVRYWV